MKSNNDTSYPRIQFKISQILIIVCVLFGAITAQAQSNYEPYSFATFAGFPPGSVDGTGMAARFNLTNTVGVAVDNTGNVYVADTSNNTIRKIHTDTSTTPPTVTVSTLAGLAGNPGSTDGTGSAARFNQPSAVAVDSAGNIYVADGNSTIRKITPAGVVTTLAGSAGNPGSADGTGSAAQFNLFGSGVAVDSSGNVYVADSLNNTIRKVTPAGVVTTLAGLAGNPGSADGTGSAAQFNLPSGVAVDNSGNIYVADGGNNTIRVVTTPAGVVTTLAGLAGTSGSTDGTGSAALFNQPLGVAVDSHGNVYVADSLNNTIRVVTTPAGVVTTLAGLAGTSGSANGTGSAARFNGPAATAVDSAGNVYAADSANNTIRVVTTPGGVVTTLAGAAGSAGSTDGTGSAARFLVPRDAAMDSAGNLYVPDQGNNTIRKITTPAGVVTTFAGLAGTVGSADGTGSAARFNTPMGTAVDSAGNIYVSDFNNNTIRKITPAGVVTTLAGLAGSPGSADGTGSAAQFNNPWGVAVDSAGNVYVADWSNHTIRKITSAGVVTTLAGLAGRGGSTDGTGSAARFHRPRGVAVDSTGNVYVADTSNDTIRQITSAGVVTTLAGLAGSPGNTDGTVSAARFNFPRGVALDSGGNLFVSDLLNNTIRKITPAGVVTTLAGLTGVGGAADGTGDAVRFGNLQGLVVDSAGNIYVADGFNNTIRVGNPFVPPVTTPTGSSVPVNAGQVGAASVSLTFPQVTMAGNTTVTVINPSSAGSLPSGFELTGAGYAYEISTTAAYATPIILAFEVPNVDAATFSTLTVLHNEGGTLVNRTIHPGDPGYPANPAPNTIYASVPSLSPFVIAKSTSNAQVQQPINADGSSVFTAKRGVVPVKFTLIQGGASTCALPPATIALTRTSGNTTEAIDESVYSGSADTGSNFRISSCQYVYNLSATALGVGTYRVDIIISGQTVGSGFFQLK